MEDEKHTVLGSYHPAVGFCYFTAQIVCAMSFTQPYFLLAGLLPAAVFTLLLSGAKAGRALLFAAVPAFLMIGALNPLFSHRGATVLFLLFGRPVTLEAFACGADSAALLVSVVLWFSCFGRVISSDRFLYLFSSAVPTTALVATMAFRLIPAQLRRVRVLADAQKTLGEENGSLRQRARFGLHTVSSLIGWSLESAVGTADSMRARGYGLRGRSSFSVYRFGARDLRALALMSIPAVFSLAAVFTGAGAARFYPKIGLQQASPFGTACFVSYIVFSLLPLLFELQGECSWRFSR